MEQPAAVTPAKAEDGEAAGETKPPSKLIDVIVEAVSKCSDEADDGVQLQVIITASSLVTDSYLTLHF